MTYIDVPRCENCGSDGEEVLLGNIDRIDDPICCELSSLPSIRPSLEDYEANCHVTFSPWFAEHFNMRLACRSFIGFPSHYAAEVWANTNVSGPCTMIVNGYPYPTVIL